MRHSDALQRLTGEPVAEQGGPGEIEADIGGAEGRDGDPAGLKPGLPRAWVRISTPRSPSRANQARSRGEVFIARGNTRPLDPMKVGWPKPSTQAVRSAGVKASIQRATGAWAEP